MAMADQIWLVTRKHRTQKHAMPILQQVLTFMTSLLVQGVVRQQRVHTLVRVHAVTAVKSSLLLACLGIA